MLASHNRGKIREFQRLLAGGRYSIISLDTSQDIIEETGSTYYENAAIKAIHVARTTGSYALSDDSGIEIDALGGEPGVHSARFVGSDPWTNTREALTRLLDVPVSKRSARMRAVLCLASPDGETIFSEGVVEGTIFLWPRGRGGFGYDPIFSVDGQMSFAEMSDEEKNRMSHRRRAVDQLLHRLGGEEVP